MKFYDFKTFVCSFSTVACNHAQPQPSPGGKDQDEPLASAAIGDQIGDNVVNRLQKQRDVQLLLTISALASRARCRLWMILGFGSRVLLVTS
jgi:hypothetical protein